MLLWGFLSCSLRIAIQQARAWQAGEATDVPESSGKCSVVCANHMSSFENSRRAPFASAPDRVRANPCRASAAASHSRTADSMTYRLVVVYLLNPTRSSGTGRLSTQLSGSVTSSLRASGLVRNFRAGHSSFPCSGGQVQAGTHPPRRYLFYRTPSCRRLHEASESSRGQLLKLFS